MRCYAVAVTMLLLQGAKAFACAFHAFPPFGADWYHESIYRMIYNNDVPRGCGVSYTIAGYSRTFLPESELPGEEPVPVLLKEQIAHRNFYYKFSFSEKFNCLASLTMTDIRSQAMADDGRVAIGSSSAGQLSFPFTYCIPVTERGRKKTEIKITGGIQSTKFSANTFYSQIGWLKYQWDKISPRLIAGNYTNAGTIGFLPSYRDKIIRIYSGASVRFLRLIKKVLNMEPILTCSSLPDSRFLCIQKTFHLS